MGATPVICPYCNAPLESPDLPAAIRSARCPECKLRVRFDLSDALFTMYLPDYGEDDPRTTTVVIGPSPEVHVPRLLQLVTVAALVATALIAACMVLEDTGLATRPGLP